MEITLTEADTELRTLAVRAGEERVTLVEAGREVAVILSPVEYRELQTASIKALHRIATFATAYAERAGLTDEKLAELLDDAA